MCSQRKLISAPTSDAIMGERTESSVKFTSALIQIGSSFAKFHVELTSF